MLGIGIDRNLELEKIRNDIIEIKLILTSELSCSKGPTVKNLGNYTINRDVTTKGRIDELEEKIKKIEGYLQISKKEIPAKKADWRYVTDKEGK